MSVDFSLAGGSDLPTRVGSFKPIDAVGNTATAYSLAGKMVDTQARVQQSQDDSEYRRVMKEYLSQDGTDLITPAGLARAATDLRGRIPADKYMALGKASQSAKEADMKFQEFVSKADTAAIENTGAQLNQAYPVFASLMEQYAADKEAGGVESARANFKQNQTKALESLSQQKLANGQPAFSPTVLQQISAVDSDNLPGVMNQLKSHKDAIDNRLKSARATAQEAIAEGGGISKGSPTGLERYQRMRDEGKITQAQYDELEKGYLEKNGAKPTSVSIDWVKNPPTAYERAEARKHLMTGKMPQVGTGGQAAMTRIRILGLATEEAESMGMSPENIVQLQNRVRASSEGLKKLMTQSAVINAGKKNVLNVLDFLESEIRKLGGPDSPKIRKFMNKAKTEWIGDPDFIGVNQAYVDLVDNMARIYSGVTGAGGTPVSFLEIARESMPSNPNLAQILKLKESVPALFDARAKATADELDNVAREASLPPKKAQTSASAAGGERVDPATQKARDTDAVRIIRDEYDKEMKALPGITDPKARERKISDIEATRRELKRKGIDVPAPEVSYDADLSAKAAKAYGKYEPDKFMYKIASDGTVLRKAK